MALRMLTLITTLGLWAIGGVFLMASGGILFSATLHRFGSADWLTYTSLGIALAAGGALTIGAGLWLAFRERHATKDLELDDDAMWLTSVPDVGIPRRDPG